MKNQCVALDPMLQQSPTKKGDHFGGFDDDDFVVNGELTVTITLHEYRELVSAAANAKTKEANASYVKAIEEKRQIMQQLDDCRQEIRGLRSALGKKEASNNG